MSRRPPWHARARTGAACVLLASLALSACGVPRTSEPTTLDASEVPYRLLDPASGPSGATPSRNGTGAPAPKVWFVTADDRLTAEDVDVGGLTGAAAAERLLAVLQAGPDPQQQDAGLLTLLASGTRVRLERVERDRAVVELTFGDVPPAPSGLPAAVGQVVLTLTSIPGIRSVSLVSAGGPAPVPLPDGRLVDRPVTAADYAGLRDNAG